MHKKKYQLVSVFLISFFIILLTLYKTIAPVWIGLASVQTPSFSNPAINYDQFKPPSSQHYAHETRNSLAALVSSTFKYNDMLTQWFKPAHLGGGGNLTVSVVNDRELIIRAFSKDSKLLQEILANAVNYVNNKSRDDLIKYSEIIEEKTRKASEALRILNTSTSIIERKILELSGNNTSGPSAMLTFAEVINISTAAKDLTLFYREINAINSELITLSDIRIMIDRNMTTSKSDLNVHIYQTHPRKSLIFIYGLFGALITLFVYMLWIGFVVVPAMSKPPQKS
jgi:hypothetical protein